MRRHKKPYSMIVWYIHCIAQALCKKSPIDLICIHTSKWVWKGECWRVISKTWHSMHLLQILHFSIYKYFQGVYSQIYLIGEHEWWWQWKISIYCYASAPVIEKQGFQICVMNTPTAEFYSLCMLVSIAPILFKSFDHGVLCSKLQAFNESYKALEQHACLSLSCAFQSLSVEKTRYRECTDFQSRSCVFTFLEVWRYTSFSCINPIKLVKRGFRQDSWSMMSSTHCVVHQLWSPYLSTIQFQSVSK